MNRWKQHRASWGRTLGVTLAVLGAAGALPGCNILGPAILLVEGPPKVPAQFTLEKKRPTVVFVDDRASVLPRRALRQQIAKSAQDVLLNERVLTNVIDTSAAMTVAAHESATDLMDITSLAKAVQAEVVIYVSVDSFSLTPDGQTYSPEAHFHVKVIDITKPEARIWPAEHEGHPLAVTSKNTSTPNPKTTGEQIGSLNTLADRSGAAIAQLFYTHEVLADVSSN
jgi:hypothetical protein